MNVFFNSAVLVGALGYFVDIFDLFLFSVVRVQSLLDLGVAPAEGLNTGILLINCQVAGLILGGFFWGILGDKKGRTQVLFGSILTYSIANILNAAVSTLEAYALLRFIAGIGLAGELGAAVSLVTESLPKEKRGWGTTLVATFGMMGGIAAAIVGQILSWRSAFLVGGLLGLALLVLRMQVHETEVYRAMEKQKASKGDLKLFLQSPQRLIRYLACICAGVPVYFVSGILITFSPEFAQALGINGITSSQAILYSYCGIVFGDLVNGMASQLFRSRKKVLFCSIILNLLVILAYLFNPYRSVISFNWICGAIGLTTGYFAVLVTLCAEQFGTNLRATAATTIPNLIRGSVLLLNSAFLAFRSKLGIIQSAAWIGVSVTLIALLALLLLDETFNKEIDYLET